MAVSCFFQCKDHAHGLHGGLQARTALVKGRESSIRALVEGEKGMQQDLSGAFAIALENCTKH